MKWLLVLLAVVVAVPLLVGCRAEAPETSGTSGVSPINSIADASDALWLHLAGMATGEGLLVWAEILDYGAGAWGPDVSQGYEGYAWAWRVTLTFSSYDMEQSPLLRDVLGPSEEAPYELIWNITHDDELIPITGDAVRLEAALGQ